MSNPDSAEWYYVGHYGQLGPLTLANMNELTADGVISKETYVWKPGMPDWQTADLVVELSSHFIQSQNQPPPPPSASNPPRVTPATPTYMDAYGHTQPLVPANPVAHSPYGTHQWMMSPLALPKSDKNRLAAGFLNVIPGFGRFYLGYVAHGILQFMTAMCGVGILWSWVDGIYILAGGVKTDGYGRELPD
ncbi:MAG: DUF4339 domain-containing protein [Fimbriimonadaceae bacterium]|nr:DUF4339 domain-containing protein [Fimbriimonadaceae bacterium]